MPTNGVPKTTSPRAKGPRASTVSRSSTCARTLGALSKIRVAQASAPPIVIALACNRSFLDSDERAIARRRADARRADQPGSVLVVTDQPVAGKSAFGANAPCE